MLEQTTEMVKQRSTSYTGAKMRDFQTVQLRMGMAAGAKIDAVRIWLRNDCIEAHNTYRAGGKLDMRNQAALQAQRAMGVKLLGEAVDTFTKCSVLTASTTPASCSACTATSTPRQVTSTSALMRSWRPWAQLALGGEFKSPTL